jgi:hypothetical protein
MAKKQWIQKAVGKNPGGLHRSLGVPADEKIPASKLAAKPSDSQRVAKEKALAKTLGKMRK